MNALKRIEQVDFLRFIFALLIALHHFYSTSVFNESTNSFVQHIINSAKNLPYIVDFFFVMAGYFLIKAENKETTTEFVKRRFLLLFPWMLLYILMMWLISSACLINYDFSNTLFSLMLVDNIGLTLSNSGVAWFISVYFVATSFYYFLIKNFNMKHIKLSIFVIVYMSYCFLIQKQQGNIRATDVVYYNIIQSGFIRGLAGVGTGCLLAWFFDGIKYLFRDKRLNSILELFFVLYLIFFLLLKDPQLNGLIYIFSFCVLFALFILERGIISTVLSSTNWHKLSKYSLAIYMMHEPFLKIIRPLILEQFPDFVCRYFVLAILIYEASVLIISVIAFNFIKKSKDYLKRLFDKRVVCEDYTFSRKEISLFFSLTGFFLLVFFVFNTSKGPEGVIYSSSELNYVPSKCRTIDLKQDNIVVKEFKLDTTKTLRNIKVRLFTWKNNYMGSLIVQVWKSKFGDTLLLEEKIDLNKVLDNELTNISLYYPQKLEPGDYSIVLKTTENSKEIALSAIEADEDSIFYNNKEKILGEDVQILLTN